MMPLAQRLPWHPVVTGLAGQTLPCAIATSRAHALLSSTFLFLFPLSLLPPLPCCPSLPRLLHFPLSLLVWLPHPVWLCCSSPFLLVLLGGACALLLLAHVPVRPHKDVASPKDIDCPAHGRLVPAQLPPPVAGTPLRVGCSPRPCGVRGRLVEGGGDLVAVVLPLRGPPMCYTVSYCGSSHRYLWGGPIPSGLVACVPPSLVLFSLPLTRSVSLVCAKGVVACSSLPPVVAVGLPHCHLGDTKGKRHFCTWL